MKWTEVVRCKECGKIYKPSRTPDICKRCGARLYTLPDIIFGIKCLVRADKVIAKRTLRGWKVKEDGN